MNIERVFHFPSFEINFTSLAFERLLLYASFGILCLQAGSRLIFRQSLISGNSLQDRARAARTSVRKRVENLFLCLEKRLARVAKVVSLLLLAALCLITDNGVKVKELEFSTKQLFSSFCTSHFISQNPGHRGLPICVRCGYESRKSRKLLVFFVDEDISFASLFRTA